MFDSDSSDPDTCEDYIPKIRTLDMHTGGEPLRVIMSGYPSLRGKTLLDKRRDARERLDFMRRYLMFEPRGHKDMYGAVLTQPDHPDADFAVLFMHNEGYSTMCGHGVLALARYAVDSGTISAKAPRTDMTIQCPCGLVRASVEYNSETRRTYKSSFRSVPAFLLHSRASVKTSEYGTITVDVSYGGAFYALVVDRAVGLDVRKSRVRDMERAAECVKAAVKEQLPISHPDSAELAYLYGVIFTDGNDDGKNGDTSANVCVFADSEVDRSPTGSGVTARMAARFAHGEVALNEKRTFEQGLVRGSRMTGTIVEEKVCGEHKAVVVEVAGEAFYICETVFEMEEGDEIGKGFLLH